MTPQEQQLLDGLIQRVKNAPQTAKDPEAIRMIQNGIGGNPDALYVLCQTTLVQSYALQQAQSQLQEARRQLERVQQGSSQPEHQPGFLERVFGSHSSDGRQPAAPSTQLGQPDYGGSVFQGQSAGQARPQQGQTYPQQGQVYPPQGQVYPPQGYGYGQPVYGQPGYAPAPVGGGMMGGLMGGGGGGFLQGAMQVAAGVAAGELLTQGLESVMHGFGHAAGYGSDHDVMGGGSGREFAGTDNSRDSGDMGGDSTFHDSVQQEADGGSGLSPDIEDRRSSSDFLGDSSADSGSGFLDGSGSGGGDDFSSDGSGSSDAGDGFDSFDGDDGGSFDNSNS